MMDIQRKTAVLEELLAKVQRNREKLSSERTVAAEPRSAVAGPRPEPRLPISAVPTPIETPRPAPVPSPIKVTAPAPAPYAPPAVPPVASAAPASVPTAAAVVESRVFESEPMASGDVAFVEGDIPRDWSLDAVLARAFRLTPR